MRVQVAVVCAQYPHTNRRRTTRRLNDESRLPVEKLEGSGREGAGTFRTVKDKGYVHYPVIPVIEANAPINDACLILPSYAYENAYDMGPTSGCSDTKAFSSKNSSR